MGKKHTENDNIAQGCSYKDSRWQNLMQFPNCTATPQSKNIYSVQIILQEQWLPNCKSKISVDKTAYQKSLTRIMLQDKCWIWILMDKKRFVLTDVPDPKSPNHLCKNHPGQQTSVQTQGSRSGKIKWFEISGILFVLLNLLKHSFKRSLKYPIARIATKIELVLKTG